MIHSQGRSQLEPTVQSPPPKTTTMDATLTPKQKKRLHEVADLMLQIFRTLARMRYLESEWIEPGPHDVSALMPLYKSLNIDPAIIYLYSILPYLKREAGRRHIFHGGEFVDFRTRRDVEQGRDPMHASDPELMMRPWMTPLSAVGNHYTALIYDAKLHVVGVYNQMDSGTSDPNYWEGVVCARFNDKGERIAYFKKREDGTEETCDVSEWEAQQNASNDSSDDSDDEEGDDDDEEEEDDDENEDEDEEGEEEEEEEEDINHWDEMDARRAGNVLRDINRWYLELFEVPGGETDGGMWDKEIVEPLYHKHGWPGEDFDGDAFLADKARDEAAWSARENAAQVLQELETIRDELASHRKEEELAVPQRQGRLAAATTLDEEWVVRWEIWQAEQTTRNLQNKVERAEEPMGLGEGRVSAEDLQPLLELEQVQITDLRAKVRLEQLKMGALNPQKIQAEINSIEKQTAIHKAYYAARQADAERMRPDKAPFLPRSDQATSILDRKTWPDHLTIKVVDTERNIAEVQAWITQLPDGAIAARKLAEELAESLKTLIESWLQARQNYLDNLERSRERS